MQAPGFSRNTSLIETGFQFIDANPSKRASLTRASKLNERGDVKRGDAAMCKDAQES